MKKSLFILFVFGSLCLAVFAGSAGSDVHSPLVHWTLDGNGEDSIGNNDLTIEGGSFDNGKYGLALSLDGSGAHAVDDNGADYLNGLEAVTVAVWIKSNQVNTDKGFFTCIDPDGKDKALNIRYDVAGGSGGGVNVIKTGVKTISGGVALESSNDVQTEDWQHVAIVWSRGEQITLYINGVEDKPTFNDDALDEEVTGLTKVILGKGAKAIETNGWDGLIDDVYIYAEALSADEIVMVKEGVALLVDAFGKLVTQWGQMKEIR